MASTGTGKKTTNKKTSQYNVKKAPAAARKTGSRDSAAQKPMREIQRRPKEETGREVRDTAVKNEIILVITAVVSILLILSYVDLCGAAGVFISDIMFGLMGVFAYIFPVILFFFIAFYLSNRGNKVARQKIIAGIGFLFLLTSLIQIISGIDPDQKILNYYVNCSTDRTGGGIFGAIISVPLNHLFGTVATVVIISALIIIFIMILTGKAIFALLKNRSEDSLKRSREKYHQREELFADIEQEEINQDINRKSPLQVVTIEPESDYTVHLEPVKEEPVSFIDELKKKGTKKQNQNTQTMKEPEYIGEIASTDSSVEMEEIKTVPDKYTITGEFSDESDSVNEIDNNAVYHEELEKKFGKQKENKPVEKLTPEDEIQQKAQIRVMEQAIAEPVKEYVYPPVSLLSRPAGSKASMTKRDMDKTADTLIKTLSSFGVHVKLLHVSCGPSVTRYELSPEQGVKVSSITKLENDIKLNLAASDIRIEAPIPGKAAIGIEVPNRENSMVMLRDLIESQEYSDKKSGISFAVGKDISGQIIVADIAKMPHLLIAGATGSGKSVCINTLIMSILYKASPADVRLIMVDPKVVELSVYNGIPHLLIPVVTDPKKASAALNWAVMEMTNRYNKFAEMHVRDLKGYNERMEEEPFRSNPDYQKLPQIVIIVDELADLMMVAPGEVEDAIRRLAQMARAAGMHLVIATQRPSVNVITGVIKANVPSRIAFAVSSNVDSRTIIDGAGAEKLLGRGDMLFFPSGYPKPIRVQGAFVSDKEVGDVVDFIKEKNTEPKYNEEVSNHIETAHSTTDNRVEVATGGRDEYFVEAGRFIIEKDKASIGMLQRVYRIGFNRAARIMEQLAEAGVVSEEDGTKPRRILMSKEQFEQYVEENA